ncbi:MAG: S-layer family protein, partial [Burkholderiales bacterium]|nr:S-layer family protein [Burkholderiales bacterium]
MNNAITFAQAHQLVPGIGLSAAQMAALTSDIVWLEQKTITLADGSTPQALVPQVYVRVQDGDLNGQGALISGQSISLNVSGNLVNRGTVAGRQVLVLHAENLHNLGRMTGQDVSVQARTDLNNLGGRIDAGDSLSAVAGRDLNVTTTTRSQSNAQGHRTHIDRVAGLYVTGGNGTLIAQAGRDLTLTAAEVANTSVTGSTVLVAGNDLKLGTVTQSRSDRIVWNAANWRQDGSSSDAGSRIQTQGDLTLMAGQDLQARAAELNSSQGQINLQAGRDISLSAGQSRIQVDEAHQHTSRGTFSKRTTTTRDTLDRTTAIGTSVSGQTVQIQANRDVTVTASQVVSDLGTTLIANRDLTIQAGQNTHSESHFREEKKSGFMSSGGFGFTVGKREQSTDQRSTSTSAAASTVGSVGGHVTLQAGRTYQQTGSDVLAPAGDINIVARKVDIIEARETRRTETETRFRQSGLTVAVSSPVISAVQTAQAMSQASKNTSSGRMQAL